jgi:hypothetical protein
VFEITVEAEGLDGMADTAIDGHIRMADCLTACRTRPIGYMTGITGEVRDNGGGVVRLGISKISRVMAKFALPG